MSNPSLSLYTADEVRELDRLAIDVHDIAGYELMRRAAHAALQELRRRWPRARRLTIVSGPGNNGGDGFLLGLLALQDGLRVHIVALTDHSNGDAARAREAWAHAGGRLSTAKAGESLPPADVCVDALFGSGLNRPPDGLAKALVEAMNAASCPVFALDVPSGLQADTGAMPGACVRATATICLVAWKQGLFTHEGIDCCGQLALTTLDLPQMLFDSVSSRTRLLQPQCLPPRQRDSHKGRYGHVLVIGGDHGFGGAVRLAGEAALRCGAGLASLATRQAHVAAVLAARPELMVHVCEEHAVPQGLLEAVSVLVVGPGLGRQSWGRRLFDQAMASNQALVLDADGLNWLAEDGTAAHGNALSDRPVVLTPHPGEAARLLDCASDDIQTDRFAAVRELARRYQCVAILKGAGSLVARPDGQVRVCPWGNPGMASGGMGDVLSGVVAALLAQGLDAWQAACMATSLHSRAGDRAAEAGQRGLLASDLLPHLRALLVPSHE